MSATTNLGLLFDEKGNPFGPLWDPWALGPAQLHPVMRALPDISQMPSVLGVAHDQFHGIFMALVLRLANDEPHVILMNWVVLELADEQPECSAECLYGGSV